MVARAVGWALVLLALGPDRSQPIGAVAERRTGDPAPPDPAALAEGQALFRGLCSGCHGGAGRGGKGPDLTDDRWIHGSTDADIARVDPERRAQDHHEEAGRLAQGRPDPQADRLSSAAWPARRRESTWKPYITGDPQAGRKLFFDLQGKAQCAKCHSVGGEGGRIGPALDRIASRRAPEFIMESILQPSKDIAPEYEAVAVATKDGRVITGLRVNETNFSIQLREENGRFHSFLKRDLDEVKVLKKSLMPENFARAADRQGAARPVRVPDDAGMSSKRLDLVIVRDWRYRDSASMSARAAIAVAAVDISLPTKVAVSRSLVH